jgi:ATP-dependent DNA ligase
VTLAPMLARPLEDDPDLLIRDNEWALETKLDGKRILASGIEGHAVRTYNRKADRTDVPAPIARELETLLAIRAVVDGELIDGRLWLFDMPACGSLATPSTAWDDRRAALEALFDPHIWRPTNIKLLPCARTTTQKRALFKRLRNGNFEGAIAKRRSSLYRPGQRSTDWRKIVFRSTVDCLVVGQGRDGKANFVLGLFCDGDLVEVGEVSALTGDGPRVSVGNVVTVTYRHLSPRSGRLLMPVKPILRDDKDASECTFDQLRIGPLDPVAP